jgi:hypothetical protein
MRQAKYLKCAEVILGVKRYLTEAEFLDEIQKKFLRVFIIAFIHSLIYCTALPRDLYFFKLAQPPSVSRVYLLYTMKEKDRKPYPLPFG